MTIPPLPEGTPDGGPAGGSASLEPAASAAAPKRSLFVRRLSAYRDIEFFMVTAIATILIVRAALAATGWPQLGGGKIHFAHLLWGGLGMLIALILFMAMQGRLWRQLATLAAGIGFGLFIDELGKFITSDNDYFFQPTIAIIYVVFVVLLLVARAITQQRTVSPQAALVNAFDLAKEAAIRDLDETERIEALGLLARCDPGAPEVQGLQAMFDRATATDVRQESAYTRVRRRLGAAYASLVSRAWFQTAIVGWYVVIMASAFVYVFATGARPSDLDFAQSGQLASAFVAGALVVVGAISWRRSRLAAYRWFERSMLVTIFIYEFFAFYEDQLTAVFGLVVLLVTYMTIRLMSREEEARQTAAAARRAPDVVSD